MNRTHLLIDVGGVIPNLALMQLSAFLKSRGDRVFLTGCPVQPDKVWISCLFSWRAADARGVAKMWRVTGAEVELGGSGIDFRIEEGMLVLNGPPTKLPQGAESVPPDYSLYPEDDRAIGFTVRGCNRKCGFCVVPRLEGRIDPSGYRPLRSWVPGDRNKVLLLDNNLAQSPFYETVLREAKEMGAKASVTQGWDARLITPEQAAFLAEHKPWDLKFTERRIYVAMDYYGNKNPVLRGIQMLLDAGFRGREIMCYILCGFDTSPAQDLDRFRAVRDIGALPFVMVYNKRRDDLRLSRFARYVNRMVWKSCEWEDYRRNPDRFEARTEPPLEEYG
jgi:hypothetical protein